MKSQIKQALDELKQPDVYSLILFTLYKVKDIPEYSTLSELIYILEKDSLLNFIRYYGGTTIRVPTMDELRLVVNSLLLYEYVNLEHMEFEKAIEKLDKTKGQIEEIKLYYSKVCNVLENYSFKRS